MRMELQSSKHVVSHARVMYRETSVKQTSRTIGLNGDLVVNQHVQTAKDKRD